jgi:SAM-dependent methyltransferase
MSTIPPKPRKGIKDTGTFEPFMRKMVSQGGPEPDQYDEFTEVVNNIELYNYRRFREIIVSTMNENTMHGFGYIKPYGYSGDFMIIDRIYKNWISPFENLKKWDIFYHTLHAPKAVRNRKDYFHEFFEEKNGTNKELQVLVLGSGPATDVFEFYEKHPVSNIHFTLVDFDPNAIEYSKEKNKKNFDRLSFINSNVFFYKVDKQYDYIWSAGLFDYFKEKHFVFMINKYYDTLKPGGLFVIGNFSIDNPTTVFMEIFSDWYLNYRSVGDLKRLANYAGINENKIFVNMEPLAVNLFLQLEK